MRTNVTRALATAALCLMAACVAPTGEGEDVASPEAEPELGETTQALTGRCHAYRRDKGWVILNGYSTQSLAWCCELPEGSQINHCYACDSYSCTFF